MSTRMTTEIIELRHPFVMDGESVPLPSGRYEVEREEETIEGPSFTAWRTVRTTLRWADAANGLSFAMDVDPDRLRAAIRDEGSRPPSDPPVPPDAHPRLADGHGPRRHRGLRDLLVPPILIPAAIGLAVMAAIILGPRQ